MADEITFNPEQCDIEPIHIPGNVQPFGVVIATDRNYIVQYVSDNVYDLIHIEAERVIGQPIQSVLGLAFDPIRRQLESQDDAVPVITEITINGLQYHLFTHRTDDIIIFDWDPVLDDYRPMKTHDFFLKTQAQVARLQAATDISSLCQIAAEAIQALVGHDRVMVYRFNDPDGHGEVIAEANSGRLESYLGLHYPATDIPPQARALFYINGIRIIPDVHHAPVKILAANAALPPLNLSASLVRGVSPGHLKYLENMGVTGSLTISITYGGKLWGLFACHHAEPRYVSRDIRDMGSFLGMVFSAQIAIITQKETAEYDRQMLMYLNVLTNALRDSTDFSQTLQNQLTNLQNLINCGGVAFFDSGDVYIHGDTPTPEQIREYVAWHAQAPHDKVLYKHALSEEYPAAATYKDVASGLIMINLTADTSRVLLWFRPDKTQTITWGRQISTKVSSPFLTPGNSFEQWEELVDGRCEPWTSAEIRTVSELLTTILEIQIYQNTQRQKAQIEQILNAIPAILIIHDDESILYANQFACDFLGIDRNDLRAYSLSGILPGRLDDDGKLQRQMQLTHTEGQQRWFYTRTMPITIYGAPSNKPVTLTQMFDITDRKLAEDAAFAIELEREQVHLLAEFLQNVSHDLRTPLTVLKSSMYFMRRTTPESQQRRVDTMDQQIDYMTRLLESMFTMVTLDRTNILEYEPVRIRDLLQMVYDRTLQPAQNRNIQLTINIAADLPAIEGNPVELDRCLTNIVDNALKFSPDGGEIHIHGYADSDDIVCEISDQGPGIDSDNLDLIFKRFYKEDSARGARGNGLGLAIAQRIVNLHHGSITAKSDVGIGTTFIIRLPQTQPITPVS